MTNKKKTIIDPKQENSVSSNKLNLKMGFYSSLALLILTLISFAFALMAIPPVGPYCPENCIEYPYENLLDHYRSVDYNWIYFTCFQICAFLVFIIANHFNTPNERKLFSSISISFATISATVLLVTYFIQFSVVPISVMNGQTEGILLLTQYNGNGIFIALEELGYILMSIAFLSLSAIFFRKNKLERFIKWVLITPFVVSVIFFILYNIIYGFDVDYRFEVATITINWLMTIIVAILISIYYKRELKKIE